MNASRKGNPYDNALAESFVATLKTECFADSIPPTKAAAKLMIFDYIESFYNPRRRHSALGYRSPAQFEHHWPARSARVVLAAAAWAARPALLSRSALAALAVNNSQELFKPPDNLVHSSRSPPFFPESDQNLSSEQVLTIQVAPSLQVMQNLVARISLSTGTVVVGKREENRRRMSRGHDRRWIDLERRSHSSHCPAAAVRITTSQGGTSQTSGSPKVTKGSPHETAKIVR